MAHPLFDRRDLRQAREPMPDPMPAPTDNVAGVLSELGMTNGLLAKIAHEERADIAQLCITDREPAQSRMVDFPCNGVSRYIVRRTGQGGSYALAANTPTLVAAANEARLGGTIVVSGAGAVTLVLTVDLLQPGSGTPISAGSPQIWLAANGGAWDFRLSNMLWAGNVMAVAAATSSVVVAEV